MVGLVLAATAVLCLAAACGPSGRERARVVAAVDSAVQAFRQANLDMDGQRVVDHLWPEFYMYLDGVRMDYVDVRADILLFMADVRSLETDWTDVEVLPLGPNTAMSSFRFRESVVLGAGTLVHTEGPTTMLWERRGAEWKLLYTDADHYPAGPSEDAAADP